MSKVSTNISLDQSLKKEAINLFNSFGLDLSTAISLFLSQAVMEQRIPFEIRKVTYNKDTLKALAEYEDMKNNKECYKRYEKVEDILKEI